MAGFDGNIIDGFITAEVGDRMLPTGISNDSTELAVDVGLVYEELGDLIITSKEILGEARLILVNDTTGESIAGVARMIDTIRQLVKEFSTVHTQNLKFEQQKEMEQIKHDNRERLLYLRNPELNPSDDDEVDTLIPFSQEDVIRKIIAARK